VSRDFTPVDLGVTASMTIRNTMRTIDSQNVVAKLEGSDPALADEYVVLTAHWDHFGIGAKVNGDSIYNGAMDNATGVAGMLTIAKDHISHINPNADVHLFGQEVAHAARRLGFGHKGEIISMTTEWTDGMVYGMDGQNELSAV